MELRNRGPEGCYSGLEPLKGQIFCYQQAPAITMPIVDDGECYAVSQDSGVTLVGNAAEPSGMNSESTSSTLKVLINKAGPLIQGLCKLHVTR